MTPVYSKSSVEPITTEKSSDTEITLRYIVPAESMSYSGGVDFEQDGDSLRVVIRRCAVGEACTPMAKSVIPLDDRWQAEVRLPYSGAPVILSHADGEVQIYP